MSLLLEDIEDLIEESQIYEAVGKDGLLDGLKTMWDNRKYWGSGQEIQANLNPGESAGSIASKGFVDSLNQLISNRKYWGSGQEIQDRIARNEHSVRVNARADRMEANTAFNKMGTPDPSENVYDANIIDNIKHTLTQLKNTTAENFNNVVDKFFKEFEGTPGIDSIKQFSETNPQVFTGLLVAIPLVLIGGGAFVGYRKIKGMNSPQQAKSAMDKAQQRVASAKSPKEKAKAEKDLALYTAKYLTLSKKK